MLLLMMVKQFRHLPQTRATSQNASELSSSTMDVQQGLREILEGGSAWKSLKCLATAIREGSSRWDTRLSGRILGIADTRTLWEATRIERLRIAKLLDH